MYHSTRLANENINLTSVALLLHEVVGFESVLLRLSVRSPRLIVNSVAFVGMLVAFNVASPINCQALYSSNQYFGNTGFVALHPFSRDVLTRHRMAAASTLLMLRTFAIWNQNKLVVVPLVILALGQWGIAFFATTTVKAHYDVAAGACVVAGVTDIHLDIIYLYSKFALICQRAKALIKLSAMFLDAVVLIMTTIGLVSRNTLCKATVRSDARNRSSPPAARTCGSSYLATVSSSSLSHSLPTPCPPFSFSSTSTL